MGSQVCVWPHSVQGVLGAAAAPAACAGNGSGHGQGVGSPQNLTLRAHGGGWPGVLPLSALPGESLTPPDALSALMHLF